MCSTNSIEVWSRKDWWATYKCETKKMRTRSQSHEWKEYVEEENLKLLWPPCLQSKNKSVTNCAPRDKEKSINSAYEDCFVTWPVLWMIPWHCLGRCHKVNSVDRCRTTLKPVFCPFWFMFKNTVIKARLKPEMGSQ